MEDKMKKFVFAVPIVALALGGTTACATKKFVRGEVSEVNDKVDTLSRTVEENQERTRTNEGKISEVDQQAQAAAQAAARPRRRGVHGCRHRWRQGRSHRKGVQAPRLRSRPERRQGELQVRQGDDAGRNEG